MKRFLRQVCRSQQPLKPTRRVQLQLQGPSLQERYDFSLHGRQKPQKAWLVCNCIASFTDKHVVGYVGMRSLWILAARPLDLYLAPKTFHYSAKSRDSDSNVKFLMES